MRFARSSSCLSCLDAVTLDPTSHGKNETTTCCKTHADDDDERMCVVCFRETSTSCFRVGMSCGVCGAVVSKQARCAVCRQHVYGSSAMAANHDVILINGPRQKHKLQLPKQYTKRSDILATPRCPRPRGRKAHRNAQVSLLAFVGSTFEAPQLLAKRADEFAIDSTQQQYHRTLRMTRKKMSDNTTHNSAG